MLDELKRKMKEVLPGIFMPAKKGMHKTYIRDLMRLVNKDPDGNLAVRINRAFMPKVELRPPEPPKFVKPYLGCKIARRRARGGNEGVVGGAIRLAKQERMIEQLGSNHVMQ